MAGISSIRSFDSRNGARLRLKLLAEKREPEGADRKGSALELMGRLAPHPTSLPSNRGGKLGEAPSIESQQLLCQFSVAADLCLKV